MLWLRKVKEKVAAVESNRRKTLDEFAKQLSQGNPLAEDFVDMKKGPMSKALQARDLAEDALANEVLKNTGIPIPDDGASRLKKEDFLNRLLQERYPELSPNVRLGNLPEDVLGQYDQGIIDLSKKRSTLENVSDLFHEAGHQYDDKILKFDGTPDVEKTQLLKNVPEGRLLKDVDPIQMNEILNKGHHARIPGLRDADSFGLGALKSYLKSGTFKGVVPAITKGALAAGGGLASLAAEAADSEEAGSSEDDRMMIAERQARENYNYSPAAQDRRNFKLGETSEDVVDQTVSSDNELRKEALRKLGGR